MRDKRTLIILASGAVLFLLFLTVTALQLLRSQKQERSSQPVPTQPSPAGKKRDAGLSSNAVQTPTRRSADVPPDAVMKVGSEFLFREDHERREQRYLGELTESVRRQLERDMIDESILLQEAFRMRLASPSPRIFNARAKDPAARNRAVAQARSAIENQIGKLTGTVVSIWIMNVTPGPLGYEESKRIAFEKISALHADVSSGKITIQQAAARIRSDESLAQLASTYAVNAEYPFSVNRGEPMTLFPEVNAAMAKLKPGQVSPVVAAKGSIRGVDADKDVLYAFGVLTSDTTGKFDTYEDWLEAARKNYSISVYTD